MVEPTIHVRGRRGGGGEYAFIVFLEYSIIFEQNLGTVFMRCSLGSLFKILSYGFSHGMEVYFLVK